MGAYLVALWNSFPEVFQAIIKAVVVLLFCLINFLIVLLMERKVAAWIQRRLGPWRVGWHGSLQILADFAKLLQKEDIVPRNVDRFIYLAAPYVAFMPALMVWLVIPFGPGLVVADYDIGIILIAAITAYSVISIFMAGWGSNNKYSLLGAMRGAAQMISYEVTLVMSIIGVVMMAGSLRLSVIIERQVSRGAFGWYLFPQIIGFIVYLIASLAELNRAPFDLTEAESELVSGYHTEYSGFRWAAFALTEYVHLIAWSAVAACLFVGGWAGPTLSGVADYFGTLFGLGGLHAFADATRFLDVAFGLFWLVFKTYAFVFVAMWIRWTLPRVRIDQLMDLGWKFLLPVSLFNIMLTGIGRYGYTTFANSSIGVLHWFFSFWR